MWTNSSWPAEELLVWCALPTPFADPCSRGPPPSTPSCGTWNRGNSPALPRVLGIDEQNREVLTYLEGETVGDRMPWPDWARSNSVLRQVGAWLRRLHDVTAAFIPADASWFAGQTLASRLGDRSPRCRAVECRLARRHRGGFRRLGHRRSVLTSARSGLRGVVLGTAAAGGGFREGQAGTAPEPLSIRLSLIRLEGERCK